MNNNDFNVANCVAEYGSNSRAGLVKCLAAGRLTNDESQILDCALDNRRASFTTCAAGRRFSPDQRRIFNCVTENRRSYLDMGVCAVGSRVSPEQRRIARCIMNNRTGNYIQMGLCVTGSQMTYEQQVFVSCAIQNGVSWAFVGCFGGQLTAHELEKCIDQGIGGDDGCFGNNDTAVRTARSTADGF